jgi:putative membrane protein
MAGVMNLLRQMFPPLKIWTRLLPVMSLLAAYGLLVHLAVNVLKLPHMEWGAESTLIDGVVLGFLIAFRNNHAYERWWEARRLWGQLINESRNLCLKIKGLDQLEPSERAVIRDAVAAFGTTLLSHLRRRDGSDEQRANVAGISPPARHEPIRVAGAIYDVLARSQKAGRLDGWTMLWLDDHVKSFMDICGACEKIRNTPLSSSYRAMLRHGIALYLAIAPFFLIEDTGLAGFPVFILACYFLLGVELVAEEIEEPFGAGGDNLPLERYCATIEQSVREILGQFTPLTTETDPALDS